MKEFRHWLKSLPLFAKQSLALGCFALLLTWLVYGGTLWLPFFFDDLVQLPFVDRYSLLEHWLGSNESPYYRPLVISIWKIESLIIGRHSPIFQHALNLIFFSINGTLTALFGMQLMKRLAPENGTSFIFGLLVLVLYLLFPFHHQAIPWPGALFHILVTTFVLASLIAYLKDRWVLALFFALLAPFCHENGVVIPALIFLIEMVRFLQTREKAAFLVTRPIMFAAPAGLWLIIRTFVNTARDNQPFFPGVESIQQSTTYFFQGLTWPGAIFGRGLLDFSGLNDLRVVWLLGCLSIVVAITICHRSRVRLRLLLFGGGWWLVASAPAMLVLPFGYIVNSPRLLSLAGCGAAIFWATVIWQLFEWEISVEKNRLLAGAATLLLALFGMSQWTGLSQTRESNRFHQMLGDSYQRASVLAESQTVDNGFPVFINFPSSMAPSEKYFPLGNEGAVFWPGYAPQHTIVTTNNDRIETTNQQFLQADAIRSDQPYLYGIIRPTSNLDDLRNRPEGAFYNTVYAENGISIFPAGNWLDSELLVPDGTFSPSSNDFKIELSGRSFGQSFLNGQLYYHIGFNWNLKSGQPNDVTVFVHAINAAGELVSQSDGDPLVGLVPLASLDVGHALHDIRTIAADPDIVGFRVGLYNRLTGERIPFNTADGQRAADDMFIFEVDAGS